MKYNISIILILLFAQMARADTLIVNNNLSLDSLTVSLENSEAIKIIQSSEIKPDEPFKVSDHLGSITTIIAALIALYGIFFQLNISRKKELRKLISEYLEFIEVDYKLTNSRIRLLEERVAAMELKSDADTSHIDSQLVEIQKSIDQNNTTKSNKYLIYSQLNTTKQIDKNIDKSIEEFKELVRKNEEPKLKVEEIGNLIDKKFSLI